MAGDDLGAVVFLVAVPALVVLRAAALFGLVALSSAGSTFFCTPRRLFDVLDALVLVACLGLVAVDALPAAVSVALVVLRGERAGFFAGVDVSLLVVLADLAASTVTDSGAVPFGWDAFFFVAVAFFVAVVFLVVAVFFGVVAFDAAVVVRRARVVFVAAIAFVSEDRPSMYRPSAPMPHAFVYGWLLFRWFQIRLFSLL